MVSCFAADCKHTNESHTCRFYRFPNEISHRIAYRIWANMCRRTDTNPKATSRLCSCHFSNGVHKIGREFQCPTIFVRNEESVMPFENPHEEGKRTFEGAVEEVMSSLEPGKKPYCQLASPLHSDDSEDEPEDLVINIKEESTDEENHDKNHGNGQTRNEPDGETMPHDGESVAAESETEYYKEINLPQIAVTRPSESVVNHRVILSPCVSVPAPNRIRNLRPIRPAPSIGRKQVDGVTPPPTLTTSARPVPIIIDKTIPIPVPIALTKSNHETAKVKTNSGTLNSQSSAHHLMTLATEADKIRKKEENVLKSETGSGSDQGDEGKLSYSDGDVACSSSSDSSGGGGVDSILSTSDQTLTLIQRRAAEASLSATSSKKSKRKRSQLPDDMKDDTYWERRRKNNEAAKRSRDARRAKEDQIAIRAALLEQENMRLRIEVAALKEETVRLRGLLYEKQ